MVKRFSGKIALVTGSSQGIGAACALKVAEQGADVIIHGTHRDETVDKMLKEITGLGRRVSFIAADLSVPANGVQLINEGAEVFGKLDILVNNAEWKRNSLLPMLRRPNMMSS
jgi:glucose 1-dehydrogenase